MSYRGDRGYHGYNGCLAYRAYRGYRGYQGYLEVLLLPCRDIQQPLASLLQIGARVEAPAAPPSRELADPGLVKGKMLFCGRWSDRFPIEGVEERLQQELRVM